MAETDRADSHENLKTLFEALAPLLHDIIGKQHEVSADVTSYKDSLNILQEKMDQLQTTGAVGSVLVDDQKAILDAIRSEIDLMRDGLADRDTSTRDSTHTEPAKSSSFFASAWAITSNLGALMLSGTMIASAHIVATQARDLTTIARRFEFQPLLMEQSIDKHSASTKRPSKEEGDSEGPTIRSNSTIDKTNVYKTPLTAMYYSREIRANQSRETEYQGRIARIVCDTDSKQTQVVTEDFYISVISKLTRRCRGPRKMTEMKRFGLKSTEEVEECVRCIDSWIWFE